MRPVLWKPGACRLWEGSRGSGIVRGKGPVVRKGPGGVFLFVSFFLVQIWPWGRGRRVYGVKSHSASHLALWCIRRVRATEGVQCLGDRIRSEGGWLFWVFFPLATFEYVFWLLNELPRKRENSCQEFSVARLAPGAVTSANLELVTVLSLFFF